MLTSCHIYLKKIKWKWSLCSFVLFHSPFFFLTRGNHNPEFDVYPSSSCFSIFSTCSCVHEQYKCCFIFFKCIFSCCSIYCNLLFTFNRVLSCWYIQTYADIYRSRLWVLNCCVVIYGKHIFWIYLYILLWTFQCCNKCNA